MYNTGAETRILPKNFFYVGINNETENVRYSKILRLKFTNVHRTRLLSLLGGMKTCSVSSNNSYDSLI